MAFIYETENFILESKDLPEIDRLDGGHVKISPKVPIVDRTQLTPKQAVELARFTMACGEALVSAMEKIGVKIGRINYQDNGNWTPHFHIHLYGRAIDSKWQKFGEPIINGNKPEYKPLNEEDISRLRNELEVVLKKEKYRNENWRL